MLTLILVVAAAGATFLLTRAHFEGVCEARLLLLRAEHMAAMTLERRQAVRQAADLWREVVDLRAERDSLAAMLDLRS